LSWSSQPAYSEVTSNDNVFKQDVQGAEGWKKATLAEKAAFEKKTIALGFHPNSRQVELPIPWWFLHLQMGACRTEQCPDLNIASKAKAILSIVLVYC
jgi:hypothetical protein